MATDISEDSAKTPGQDAGGQSIKSSVRQSLREVVLLALFAVAGYLLLALVSYAPEDPGYFTTGTGAGAINLAGVTGAWIADFLLQWFGWFAYVAPLVVALVPIQIFFHYRHQGQVRWLYVCYRLLGGLLMLFSLCTLGALHFTAPGLSAGAGGIAGAWLGAAMMALLNLAGSTLLLLAVLMIGIALGTGLSWVRLAEQTGRATLFVARTFMRIEFRQIWRGIVYVWQGIVYVWQGIVRVWQGIVRAWQFVVLRKSRTISSAEMTLTTSDSAHGTWVQAEEETASVGINEGFFETPLPVAVTEHPMPTAKTTPPGTAASGDIERVTSLTSKMILPAIDLLVQAEIKRTEIGDEAALSVLAQNLERQLGEFGVEVKVEAMHPGPVITRLEVQPAPGVKVSRISALVKDLARSLAVVSVRVVEVIPGKTVVGIEIPNAAREIVRLADTLKSKVYKSSKSYLTLALGKDIAGHTVCTDLARMPHLLIAGTTGSGKSVGVNAILLSILFKANPEQVRLILVDPKMLELSVYEGIPHLLTPVITDMKQAASALRWCVYEMERRYQLMASTGVRNLAGFNEKVIEAQAAGTPLTDNVHPIGIDQVAPPLTPLPLIVVVVDEFADMMMIVGKKVEGLIVRIAQKARAAGIHLVLATQRPSVDVITGLIKANIPGRISFQVSSRVDSRTILDQGGAEQLLGYGDMLFMPPGTSMPTRIHGALVEDEEVHRVVKDWCDRSVPDYLPEVLSGGVPEPTASVVESSPDEGDDELYDQAVAFVVESRRATISSLQRKLRIGYNRAARLIEVMEVANIVSTMDNAGNREVLVPSRNDS